MKGQEIKIFKQRKISKLRKKEEISFYLFILPWIIGFFLFSGGPIFATLGISLTDWSLFGSPHWSGLSNYTRLFTDPLFYKVFVNTLYYVGGRVALMVIISLLAAILLNQKLPGITVFRVIYYLPAVITGVALSTIFVQLYRPIYGPFAYFFSKVGVPAPSWLIDEKWAMPALILMNFWIIGPNTVIFLAALQGIPKTLYEAGQIDGANFLQQFFHVTLPMLSSITLLITVITTVESFQVFAEPYILTRGGPNYSTLVGALYIYRNAFKYFNLAYACAFAWILLLMVIGFTGVQFLLSRHWAYYAARRK